MRGHLFFDLDGTLTDPKEGIVACFRHALRGVDAAVPTDDALARLIGPPLQESLRHLVGHELQARALELFRERFRTTGMFENRVYPGIPEALRALAHAGWELWVVTSKPLVFAQPILAHFDLAVHFRGAHGSELSGQRSNKGELIAHVLRTEGIAAEHATMIGDRSHDVVGALANQVRALGVLWGYGDSGELAAAGAAAVYGSIDELVSDLTAPIRRAASRGDAG